ncbi:amidase domain-containing protein [Defluviitalea phaphyphila]|uniref:amidase domain-containing protein n=1 Tax=Defluviitalea phaphyphila TaxID=1473580 RepID=UPI000730AD39|nr:amidase domain-containing protein [Defluviitalea phaphyphila]
MKKVYDRQKAVEYAIKYGLFPNTEYVYYQGNDCTNFISQCLRAGGAKNHYHPTHPWWYENGKSSICWAVANSLYWYIRVMSTENKFGIKAKTISIKGDYLYNPSISHLLEIGDIIQYRNNNNKIQHSAIISGFEIRKGIKEPLICQHTFEAINITWRKNFKETIFHHIIGIN